MLSLRCTYIQTQGQEKDMNRTMIYSADQYRQMETDLNHPTDLRKQQRRSTDLDQRSMTPARKGLLSSIDSLALFQLVAPDGHVGIALLPDPEGGYRPRISLKITY